jgi:iron(III) transport system substrate-binding protein
LRELADAASSEGPVIWYESTPPEQIDGVIKAFNERYPDVRVEQVRSVGGRDVAARIVQESRANAETADIATSGITVIHELEERGLLADLSADELEVNKKVIPVPYAMVTAASVDVALYNSEQVSEEEAPKSWEDLLDPKWKGKLGAWAIPTGLSNLPEVWGQERTTRYVEDFAAQQPRLYSSTFPLASDVGTGEVPVALAFYHSAQPPIKGGAPIKINMLDPTPIATIFTGLVKDTPNPNAAKLFLSWLHSDEGARAYEDATYRGNPYLGTKSALQNLTKGS